MEELISRKVLLEEFEWLLSVVNESSKDEVRDVIQRIKNVPTVDAVSRGLFDQYKWERDVAISQLEELGLSFGQKIDGFYITKENYNKLLECADRMYRYGENLFVSKKLR